MILISPSSGGLFSSPLSVQLSKNFRFTLIFLRMILVIFINLPINQNSTKCLFVGSFHSYNTSRHHFEISGHAPSRRCLHPVPHFPVRCRPPCRGQPHAPVTAAKGEM